MYMNQTKANKKLKTLKTQRISLSYYDKVKKNFKTYREIFQKLNKCIQNIL